MSKKVFVVMIAIFLVIMFLGFSGLFQTNSSTEMNKVENGLAQHKETKIDANDTMQNRAFDHMKGE